MMLSLYALSICFSTPIGIRMPNEFLEGAPNILESPEQRSDCNEEWIQRLIEGELPSLCQELSEKNGIEKKIDCVDFVKNIRDVPVHGEKLCGAILTRAKSTNNLPMCLTKLMKLQIEDSHMLRISYRILNTSEWNMRRIQETGNTTIGSWITQLLDKFTETEINNTAPGTSVYMQDLTETVVFMLGKHICEKCSKSISTEL